MAIYTQLPLYHAAYALMLDFSQLLPNMPRDCRYTLGQDVRNKIMDIILLVYKANRNRKKANLITEMRERLIEIQVYMRLMCDLKYISERCFVKFLEQTSSMSKQMVAWEKSEMKKNSGGAETEIEMG